MSMRRAIPDLPTNLTPLFETFQNPTRVIVLRFVLAHPGATRQEVVDGTGAAAAPVYRALAALEHAGYLGADASRGARSGRTVHYTADRGRLSTDAGTLFGWLVS
jgi:hypothetical protein